MTTRRLAQLISLVVVSVFSVGLFWVGGCTPEPPAGDQDAALADAGDVASDYPEITVATFNVRLFFDTECHSWRGCDSSSFEKVPTQEEFEARADQLAAAVEGLDADVVLLQEIENQNSLDALQAAIDSSYPVAVLGEIDPDWASVDVAVLARGELVDTKGYREEDALERPDGSTTDFAREFLRVDLDIDGEEVIVFSAHFTSKVSDDPGRRLAEAQAARDIVEQVAADNDDALVVFGGDLNDTPDSDPLQAITGDGGFVRVAAEKSLEETFTYVYRGDAESIDHLLLAPTSGGAYVDGSVRSVHDRNPAGYGGSDHGALVADFEMR